MRNEIFTDRIGRPVCNMVLVSVEDTFNEIKTDSGLILPNAAHADTWSRSPGYSFDEFAIRFGKVVSLPKVITAGSFDYETELEIEVGDTVYWNLMSFKNHIPVTCGDKKYLLVDYHEIIMKVDQKGQIEPLNGYCLFTPIAKEESFGVYKVTEEITEKWKIYQKPKSLNVELNPRYVFDDIWEVGDIVLLLVATHPFKIEGDLVKHLPVELFAAPLRMILCEA